MVPGDFKARNPEIEWKKMARMGYSLIREYFGIDYFIVFDVARNKAPGLTVDMKAVLS